MNILLSRAEILFKDKKFDSALTLNLQAVKIFTTNKTDPYHLVISPVVMRNTGLCYKELNQISNAHKYLTWSLQLARANKINIDIEAAFTELVGLHQLISKNKLPFNYPPVASTEEADVFFPVTKVERFGPDSLRLTIQAGRYDGVEEMNQRAGVISRHDTKEKERPFGLVNCYIRELHDNYSIAHATYDSSLLIKEGDLAELKTRVPLYWQQLDIGLCLKRNIILANNYRQPVFQYRYLYYYADSLTNRDIAMIIRSQVDEVVQTLAPDTLKGDFKDVVSDRGLFAGANVIKAMADAKPEHFKLFLSYLNKFPRTYLGNVQKVSDLFGTWIFAGTPLSPDDVLPVLSGIKDPNKRKFFAANLSKDISDNELLDKWFNEGMLLANAGNTDSSLLIARVIADASLALDEKNKTGWASYLQGYAQKKLGNYKSADTLFRIALKVFNEAGNKEGETWAQNAITTLQQNREVKVMLQTGHLFPYHMAISPNSKFMATAGIYDRHVKIWDMLQSREIASFEAHDDEIHSIQYSPNGRYIVTASADSSIKIWNAYDFTLLKTFARPKPENIVIFTTDSKQLVAGGQDSLIKFLDLNNGSVIRILKKHRASVTSLCFNPQNDKWLFSGGNDSIVYKWDLESNEWNHWYGAKGRILRVDVSNNGRYLSFTSTDSLVRVWKLENNKFYFNIKPHLEINRFTSEYAIPAFTTDSRYMVLSLKVDTLCIIELATLKEQVYKINTPGKKGIFDISFSPDGSYLAARMDQGGSLRIYNFTGWDFHRFPTINHKELKNYANIPLAVQFTRDDNGLVIVHEGISKTDLRNGSTSFLYYGALFFQNNYILLNNENIGVYSDTQPSYLKFFDHVKKQTTLKLSLPDETEELTRFELTANNKYIFLAGKNNTVSAFSLPDGKMLYSKSFNTGEKKGITFIRYDSLRQRLYLIGENDLVLVANAFTGEITDSLKLNAPSTVEVTPAYLYITCDKSEVIKYDAASLKLLKKIKVHASGKPCFGSVMSHDYKYLVVQVADKMVAVDTRSDKIQYERNDHDYQNGIMAISHNNRLLATGGFDSRVNIYELATGKKLSTIFTPREKDFMLVDNEGHYLAPKNTLEAVSFQYNNSSYGFEQFDTRFNRPDLVLKKIGRADSSLLKTYYAAWQKRLQKLNIREKDLSNDVHLPVTRLKDKSAVKPVTSLSEYELNVECFDAKYPLKSIQVLVNNNPLFGVAGIPVQGNAQHYSGSIKIPLSTGNNIIKVFCNNQKGASSLAEYIYVNSTYKAPSPPKTLFIGIAVSEYKDSSMNLRFAAKDVRDLASSFGKMYKEHEADTLIDAMATRENILNLRQKLMQTSVNDKVIISVNGHGLLSDSLDFYYATWDTDFSNPVKRGLKYEDLEALLDGIPARKKLLLIDACHSGALDKEEMLAQQKKKDEVKNIQTGNATVDSVKAFAARGTITRNKQSRTDAGSTYEVMQNLFTDLSTGNGAVIISAAGGMEYAFESDKWNNGVFTYCVRRGIEEDLADKEGGNGDKLVDVTELKNYVSRRVFELTGGKQRPVSRRENIDYNWIVW